MKHLSVILAITALLTACASSPPVSKPASVPAATAAPAEAPVSAQLAPEPGVLVTDLMAASALAKASAAAASDPSTAKLAADRALCYDTLVAHVNALTKGVAQTTPAKGIFSLEEKGIELKDQLSGQSSNLIPVDIQANCASYAAQKTAAVVDFVNRIATLAGLKGNPVLAPLNASVGAAAAVIRAQ